MRYNLESTLPIDAFSPRGGKNNPFVRGMTLEGGGGGIVGGITKGLGSVAKGVTGAVKGIVQPIYNATLKNIPGVDKALVGLDKAVGKSIPGGWGTVASVASTFIPGSTLALAGMTKTGLATGLGALSGSGVMKKDHQFNLQGAIMGGAMAYGASQLSQGLQEAGKGAAQSVEEAAKANTTNALAQSTPIDVNAGLAGTAPAASVSDIAPDLFKAAQSNIDPSLLEGMSREAVAGANVLNTVKPPLTGLESLAQAGKETLSNVADAGRGIKNLAGFGSAPGTAEAARAAFTAPITQTGLVGGIMGATGLMALEEQQKYLDSQLASGALGQAEYDAAKAKIDAQVASARETVSANPLQTSADISGVSEGESLYDKGAYSGDTLYDKSPYGGTTTMYAEGGQVATSDDQTGMLNQTPLQTINKTAGLQDYADMQSNAQPVQAPVENTSPLYGMSQIPVSQGTASQGTGSSPQSYYGSSGLGSIDSGSGGTFPLEGQYGIVKMAAGGMAPRFLSGGGDGMSDSIRASIEGRQEARLADGEFVIPADVVSHIGNGSSKAGAKQLYSMMDRVRQARVGTKKQGKQINPRKYLAA